MATTTVRVRVEVPRGAWAKRDAAGRVEFWSPVPCPFDYGALVGVPSADGEEADAIVLGTRSQWGDLLEVPVWGAVRFVDRGLVDDKWVCGRAPTPGDRQLLRWFFRIYGMGKRLRHPGARTGVTAWDWGAHPSRVGPPT